MKSPDPATNLSQRIKKRILFIDDEGVFTRLLPLIFNRPEYDVCAVNDTIKTLETVRQFKPDMIFLCIDIPLMDGPKVTALVKEIPVVQKIKEDRVLRKIPIALLTEYIVPTELPIRTGPSEFAILYKSEGVERIVQCIREHLGP